MECETKILLKVVVLGKTCLTDLVIKEGWGAGGTRIVQIRLKIKLKAKKDLSRSGFDMNHEQDLTQIPSQSSPTPACRSLQKIVFSSFRFILGFFLGASVRLMIMDIKFSTLSSLTPAF